MSAEPRLTIRDEDTSTEALRLMMEDMLAGSSVDPKDPGAPDDLYAERPLLAGVLLGLHASDWARAYFRVAGLDAGTRRYLIEVTRRFESDPKLYAAGDLGPEETRWRTHFLGGLGAALDHPWRMRQLLERKGIKPDRETLDSLLDYTRQYPVVEA